MPETTGYSVVPLYPTTYKARGPHGEVIDKPELVWTPMLVVTRTDLAEAADAACRQPCGPYTGGLTAGILLGVWELTATVTWGAGAPHYAVRCEKGGTLRKMDSGLPPIRQEYGGVE